MRKYSDRPLFRPPERQADAVLDQANPTDGTAYTVLAATPFIRILGAGLYCDWTVQPTSLQLIFVIDGQTITFTIANPVALTWYYPAFAYNQAPAGQVLSNLDNYETNKAFFEEGKSVTVQAVVNGGTATALYARLKYARFT